MGNCFSLQNEHERNRHSPRGESPNRYTPPSNRYTPPSNDYRPPQTSQNVIPIYRGNNVELADNPKLIYNHKLPLLNDETSVYGGKIYIGSLCARQVLLKSIKKHQTKYMENELSMLSNGISHENIASILFKFDAPDEFFLVTDFHGEPLSARWFNNSQSILRQLMDVIVYLHSKSIAHLEICPRNVYVSLQDNAPKIKLINFHKAQELKKPDYQEFSTDAAKFDGFTPPEILVQKKFSLSSDIYSLGCVFFFIMTKGLKMTEIKHENQSNQIPARLNAMLKDESTSKITCKDLISKMLKYHGTKRLTANEALTHPFFWSGKQMTSFIVEISKLFEIEKESDRKIFSFLSKGSDRIIKGDWVQKLEPDTVKALNEQKKGKTGTNQEDFNGKNIVQLVKTLRNTLVHAQSDEISKIMGDTDDEFMKYWNDKFPHLMLHLYNSKIDYEMSKNQGNQSISADNNNNNNAGRNNRNGRRKRKP